MATVLLGWELGGGLGHIRPLVVVAERLAAAGHRPVLAMKDVVQPRSLLGSLPYPVVAAPVLARPSRAGFAAHRYTDILGVRGWSEPPVLEPLVEAWQHLIELTGAELVVAEHSPTLCLAAYAALPTVLLGAGFWIPPSRQPEFPPLNTKARPTVSSEHVLSVVRDVQQRRGRPVPDTLPALFAHAAPFCYEFPELDPYRHIRSIPHAGPIHPVPRPAGGEPTLDYFAYLKAEFQSVQEVFRALSAAGLRGSAYVRGASDSLAAALRSCGVHVHPAPVDIRKELPRARAVVHHGGVGLSQEALAAGRPQLLLPLYLEQRLRADRLSEMGVAVHPAGRVSLQSFTDLVRRFFTVPEFPEQARKWAEFLENRGPSDCLERLVGHCQRVLGNPP